MEQSVALTEQEADELERLRLAALAVEKSLQLLLAWDVMQEEVVDTLMKKVVVEAGESRYRKWWRIWEKFMTEETAENTAMAAWDRHRRRAKMAWRRSLGSDHCVLCLR